MPCSLVSSTWPVLPVRLLVWPVGSALETLTSVREKPEASNSSSAFWASLRLSKTATRVCCMIFPPMRTLGQTVAGFIEALHADLLALEHDGFRVALLAPGLGDAQFFLDAQAPFHHQHL